ncbi:MAG: thioredoxin [Bacteroidota bacterium]|nr:thioredoxin [Bacteroidota bacterium]
MKNIFFVLSFFVLFSASACNSGENKPDQKTLSDEGKVVHLTTAEFKNLVWDYTKSPDTIVFKGNLPCIVDFYADWCRPCKMVAPILDELALDYKGKIRIYKINTDQEREMAGFFRIRSIPTVLFIPMHGKPQISVGAMPKDSFIQAIREVLMVN